MTLAQAVNIFSPKTRWLLLVGLETVWSLLCVILPYYFVLSLLAFFVILLLILIKFKWGVYFLAFLVPIVSNYIGFSTEVSYIFKSGFKFFNYCDSVPFFMLISLPTIFSLALNRIARLRNYFARSPLNILFLILLCWLFLLLLYSPNISYSIVVFFNFAINILLFYLMVYSIDEESFHRKLIWCWIFTGLIIASIAFASCYFVFEYVHKIDLWGGVSFISFIETHIVGRAQGLGHPNETSLLLNLFICITMGMMLCEKNKIKKGICGTILLFLIFANFLTMSKSGMLAFLIMIHFLLVSISALRMHFFRNLVLFNTVWIILFCLGIIFIGDTKTPRLIAGGSSSELGLDLRLKMWKEGVSNLINNTAGIGLGPGGFRYYTKTHMPYPHSLYVSILCDFGFVGLLLFLLAILVMAYNYFKMLRFQETYLQIMFLCCCGGLLALGVHGLVDSTYLASYIWFFLGLSTATFHLAQKELDYIKKGN